MVNFGPGYALTSRPVLIGDTPALLDAITTAARVADTTAGVLIQGESGTGKELLARFLHWRSRRRSRPFIPVNCAAPSEASLERELFGVAETEGVETEPSAHLGKLEQASGGTLFLDEVGEMSGAVQARVLRALEQRALQRIGGERSVPIDVRLVAASRRPLGRDVPAGHFRADLYYRLAVIVLTLPPLRERGDDVRMLAEHFVGSFAYWNGRYDFGIARSTLSLLEAHPWPGNVRQMKQTLERAASGAGGPLLVPADFPAEDREIPTSGAPQVESAELLSLDELGRRHIEGALSMTGGHLDHAARLLGIDQFALRRRLRRYGFNGMVR